MLQSFFVPFRLSTWFSSGAVFNAISHEHSIRVHVISSGARRDDTNSMIGWRSDVGDGPVTMDQRHLPSLPCYRGAQSENWWRRSAAFNRVNSYIHVGRLQRRGVLSLEFTSPGHNTQHVDVHFTGLAGHSRSTCHHYEDRRHVSWLEMESCLWWRDSCGFNNFLLSYFSHSSLSLSLTFHFVVNNSSIRMLITFCDTEIDSSSN